MDELSQRLNELMTETFSTICKIEEAWLSTDETGKLSINEWHLIACIGRGGEAGLKISEISKQMCITLASVTVAVNKLVKKGWVEKIKGTEDAREVFARLTREGRKIENAHNVFHCRLTKSVSEEMTYDEKKILVNAIQKIKVFFEDAACNE